MRWIMLLAGLIVLLIIIYSSMVASQSGFSGNEAFGGLLCFSLVFLIGWIVAKRVVPLAQKYRFEYNEHMKEQQHLAQHRPPTDTEYRNWIGYLSSIIYAIAVEKLYLPESKEYTDWKTWQQRTGEAQGPAPERWKYSADLQLRGFQAPSGDKKNLPSMAMRHKKDLVLFISEDDLNPGKPLRRGTNYSINSFTRLFVTKNFIAIYRRTINVRQPERVIERSEHVYHQHLTRISLEIDAQMIGDAMLNEQHLTLTLDSGHTIPLDVASATFFYKGTTKTDIDDVHSGLIDALHEHKLSTLNSMSEASKMEDAE